MNITIIGRKCTPRESFKERAELKLKGRKVFRTRSWCQGYRYGGKNIKIVEITLSKGGFIFRSQERSQDLEDALDKCVDSLIRQIRKNKTRLAKRIRDVSFDEAFNSADDSAEEEYDIVRTKAVILKPQSSEEAILQMNMLGHEFYMFRNADTDDVNVVYKRADGGYGILEPTEGW